MCVGSPFPVTNAATWDFVNGRGGLATFGCPISRTFLLQGFTVQFFQRQVVQLDAQGRPRLLNLLDPEYLPYSRVNGSTFPDIDAQLKARTPKADDPDYVTGILSLIDETVPDSFEGLPVAFHQTFMSAVTPEMAGTTDPAVLGMLNLQMWGVPTSLPMRDPSNPNAVYQRFQRAIMSYDAACDCVQSPLLASYLRDIIIGSPLPPDLDAESAANQSRNQYAPGAQMAVKDPNQLPNTDLTDGFTGQ
jgi:hypothetical protein